jgi:hypothetical protein
MNTPLPESNAELSSSSQTRRGFQARLIDSSPDCIKVLDLEGRLVSMSAGGMKALEICDFEPMRGRRWIEFWQGEDRRACETALAAARQGGVGKFVGLFPTTQSQTPKWWDRISASSDSLDDRRRAWGSEDSEPQPQHTSKSDAEAGHRTAAAPVSGVSHRRLSENQSAQCFTCQYQGLTL